MTSAGVPPLVGALVREVLGTEAVRAAPLRGGDIHSAWQVWLRGGARAFAKGGAEAPPDLFELEAHGLHWLAEGPLRIPRVLGSSARGLLLEWIEPGAPAGDADEQLGRGLAELHGLGAPHWGRDRPTYLGTIAQDNTPAPDWPTFYGERRLRPLLTLARDLDRSTPRMCRGLERVLDSLSEWIDPGAPPARLHGDLWSGNRLHDGAGAPVLVDPAAYGGDREVDLAMMRLFGGFSECTFAAYAEAAPLAPGHRERVPLYQLLPLLAHVVLFGGSYLASLQATLDQLLCGAP